LPVAQANGVNLYYELSGERGDPMLLIHGSWSDHSIWSPVIAGLSEGFRVLTYDRRGHSKSEKTSSQGSGEEDAADAAALLARLNLVPAHVVGNSSGGSIALKMAVIQPQVLRSLNAHEPPLYGLLAGDPSLLPSLNEGNARREQVIRTLEGGDRAAAARLFVDTMTLGPGAWERMSLPRREMMVANADTWLDETKDKEGSTVDLGALAHFTKPALLTYGGRGLKGSKLIIEKLAKALPNSTVKLFPDDGHSPHASNPEEFVGTAMGFARSAT
jgi:pimeloyl-ACP methyl ester carboxylesterase